VVNRIAPSLLSVGIHLREHASDEFHSGGLQTGLLKELPNDSVFRRFAPIDAAARQRPIACIDTSRAHTAKKEAIVGIESERVRAKVWTLLDFTGVVMHLVPLPPDIGRVGHLAASGFFGHFQERVAREYCWDEAAAGRER
jgi:hypothetical protein